jgi:hypothetical protein
VRGRLAQRLNDGAVREYVGRHVDLCESASLLDPACTNRINDLARRSASGPRAE